MERYFTEKFATQHQYSAIGTYWEKGNQNEIGIIAVNDFEKTVLVAEVKRKKENISIPLLQGKGQNLQSQLKGYTSNIRVSLWMTCNLIRNVDQK